MAAHRLRLRSCFAYVAWSRFASNFDFYDWPLYAYMEQTPSMKVFTVGFFAFWNHWLWGIGILLFGAFSISMVVRNRET